MISACSPDSWRPPVPTTASASTVLVNPADATVLRTIEHVSLEGVDDAIARAVRAQRGWATLPPAERAAALRRFAVAVDGAVEELAWLEVRNSGHPISQARWEAGHVRDVLNYYAAAPERMIGKQIPVAGGIDLTFLEPLGVVGVIVPWNFPMTIAAWGFAPALAAGNAVVLKPADWTPLTAIRIGELGLESGLPEGLFQVLPGRGSVVGERFITNESVRKIVFTGSTEVGKRVMAGCAEQVKAVTLELGGKSANVIFADSDLAVCRIRERGPGLLRAQPHPRRAKRVRPVPRAARARGQGRQGRRARQGNDRDGSPRRAGPPRQGDLVRG
jgi:acyl-CoA reductase-like NAD-dependent aldehyde dehydrogenase